MDGAAPRQQNAGASGLNILLGIWLIIAPFVLGYSGNSTPLWNDIIFGVLIAIRAWSSAASTTRRDLPTDRV